MTKDFQTFIAIMLIAIYDRVSPDPWWIDVLYVMIVVAAILMLEKTTDWWRARK